MDNITLLNAINASQQQLDELATYLAGQASLKASSTAAVFLHDLRDYCDTLSVVTDLVDDQSFSVQHDATQLSNILVDQAKLIAALRENFENHKEIAGVFMSEGEMRRTAASLSGVKELNTLMLQDNLRFQKELAGVTLGEPEVYQEPKVGFFKRLFGR